MASSYTNLFKEPTDQNNKSDRLTETSDESKNALSAPSPVVKETITAQSRKITACSKRGICY